MKASEFGQSLLSDIRERNKDAQKRAEKRAKRNQWKQVGLKVAFNVAEDLLMQRHQKMMNNEEMMANKLKVDSVYNEANDFAAKYQEAKDYAGGQDAYLKNELQGLIGSQLHNTYEPGTYNKSQFNSLQNTLTNGYFDKYKESFESRVRAHKQFMASGDKERYYKNLRTMQGDGTIGSSLTQLIKKIPGVSALTGNVNKDLHKANQEILSSLGTKSGTRVDKDGKTVESKGLQTYQEVYRKTRDTELAAYVANEVKDFGLSGPAPDFGERFEMEITNSVGITRKVPVREKTSYNSDGSIANRSIVHITAQGYVSKSAEQTQGEIDFLTGASLLKDFEAGSASLRRLSTEETETLQSAQTDYLKDAGVKSTASNYGDMLESMSEDLARSIQMGGQAAPYQGWGTPTVGREITLHMIKKDVNENEGVGNNVTVGLDNPFETAIAAAELLETKKISASSQTIPKIMSNGVKLYNTLYGLDLTTRANLDTKLEELDYFNEYADGEKIESMVNIVKYAVDNNLNPSDFDGKDKMLAAVQTLLQSDSYNEELGNRQIQAQKQQEEKERQEKEAKRLAAERRNTSMLSSATPFSSR